MAFQLDRPEPTILDRPGLATQNLLAGDMPGAWRSMLEPEQLEPLERDALMNKWGVKPDSFQGKLLATATNPAVLLSILFTMKFPVPTARNLFKVKEGVEGMLAKVPLLRSLSGARVAFKGTAVPGILDDLARDSTEIWDTYMSRRLGPAFSRFEQQTGRAVTAREQVIMFNWLEKNHVNPLRGWGDEVGVLMPTLDKHMTAPMRQLATEVRGTLDDTLEHVWKDPKNVKALREGVKRMADRGYPDEDLTQLVSLLDEGGYDGIADYMPHRAIRTGADVQRLRDAAIATANNQDFKRQAQYKIINFLGKEFYERKGGMMPNMQDLMLIGDIVDKPAYMRLSNAAKDKLVDGMAEMGLSPKSVEALRHRTLDDVLTRGRNLIEEGEGDLFSQAVAEHMPAQYSQRLEPVLQQYYHSVKSTYAWTIKGNGARLLGEVQTAKLLAPTDARAAWRAHVLENTVVPSALGKPTPRQVINAQLWDQRMGTMVGWLDKPSVRALTGDKFADKMKDYYQANLGSFSLRGLTMAASSYFYLSTLGLNPSAAFKNTFQPVFTTGSMVGFKNMFQGHLDAWEKSGTYFEGRMKGGLSHADAMAKAFPEFAEAGLAGAPVTDEALGRAFDAAYRIHKTAPGGISILDRVKRASMAMFTATETNNRVGAFYAGMRHAAQDGLRGAEAVEHARRVVVRSQYMNTLADQPLAFLPSGPLSNPLLRQFAQFPLRTLEFTVEGVQDALTGNPARLVRQVAGTYITSEVGDVLGLNLTDALLTGGLPSFTPVDEKGSILAPLPIVPPVIALGAGVASAFAGDWETIHRQLPLLIPGGVGLSRAVGFLPGPGTAPQTAARWLGRKYADYTGANPLTGRVPVYTGGGSLTGYYQPWELVKYSLGIHGGEIDKEAEMASRLTKDAELIKQTRRNYTDALFGNDARKAAGIESEYEARFGHKLAVTQEEVLQMQERRKMTRIERQLATMPQSSRSQYEQTIAAQGNGGQSVLPNRRGRAMTAPPPNYTNQMGPLDELDPYAISRYRNIPESFPTDQPR